MKIKLIAFIIFFTSTFIISSQNFKTGDLVILNNSVPVKDTLISVYSEGLHPEKKLKYLEAGVKFRIIEITDTEVKLMAIPFKKKRKNRESQQEIKIRETNENKIIKSEYYNNKVYTVTLKNFNAFAKTFEFEDRISIGLLTLPFKARPQDDFSFDTEFNLSTTVNFRLGNLKGASINGQLGAGIGSVGLNSENALGITDDNSQDVATLTFFSGLMLQYKKVQIGLYAGVDQINNQSNYQWKSNGNLWLGFGIGFNVFSVSISSPKNNQ